MIVRFPGLILRIKRPKTAILIFNTGKMVCTGAKLSKESDNRWRYVEAPLPRIIDINRIPIHSQKKGSLRDYCRVILPLVAGSSQVLGTRIWHCCFFNIRVYSQ
jgi:hypothetical protein